MGQEQHWYIFWRVVGIRICQNAPPRQGHGKTDRVARDKKRYSLRKTRGGGKVQDEWDLRYILYGAWNMEQKRKGDESWDWSRIPGAIAFGTELLWKKARRKVIR